MNSGLQPIKLTVAAGVEDVVNVAAGRFFTVKEASSGSFELALDDGAFLPWDAGMGYAIPEGVVPFNQIRFRNTSGNPITFQLIVGAGRVYDQRLTVVATRVGDSLALDGADGTGISAPDGGVGIRGFLSGIYDRLKTAGPLGVIATASQVILASIRDRLPVTLGPRPTAQSLSICPGTFTGMILSVSTAAVGTNWTAFGSQACFALEIVNSTGTALEYRRGGAGFAIHVASGASRKIEGIANADEISVRRVDTSNAQVNVTAEALI